MSIRATLRTAFNRFEGILTTVFFPLMALRDRFGHTPRVTILALHKVAPLPPETSEIPYYNIDPQRFECLLDTLHTLKIPVIGLADFVAACHRGGRGLPRRAVILTFDDGFENVCQFAYPRLKERGWPLTIFLATDGIEGGEFSFLRWDETSRRDRARHPEHWAPLSWESARSMDTDVVELGSHTCSHIHLGNLDSAAIRRELTHSRDVIRERTGRDVTLFSYPFGTREYGAFSDRTRQALIDCGYLGACTSETGRCSSSTDLFELKRIDVSERETPFSLRCKLVGAYTWVGMMRKLFQRVFADVKRPQVTPDSEPDGSSRSMPKKKEQEREHETPDC